jgi:uncharacterized protein (DUF433 family)
VHALSKISGENIGRKYGALAESISWRYYLVMNEPIAINPQICGGQPVIKGTRIPLATIWEQLETGESWDSSLLGYPELGRDDIQAALEYARHSIQHTEISLRK